VIMASQGAQSTEVTAAADQRRDHMLRAALAVIDERGFPETRIADVAERAGTSPALVIYYFKTKDNLLTEAMRYAEDSWYDLGARRMAAIDSAAKRLEEIVAMTCLPQADAELPESWTLWLDLWAQSVRHPEVARVREEFDNHWRETIASVVRDGQENGEFGPTDADDFSVTLSALLDGLAIQIALDDPVVDPLRAFEASMRFAAQSLGFPWKSTPSRRSAARVKKGSR
jgi:AcrR family transcriptional regulator